MRAPASGHRAQRHGAVGKEDGAMTFVIQATADWGGGPGGLS